MCMLLERYYSWGDMNKCLLTQDKELITDQSMDITKSKLDESISLIIGVTCRNMGEGLLTKKK